MTSPRTKNGKGMLAPVPPNSPEAEQATLGAALISQSAVETVMEMLVRDDFYLENHRRIFEAIAFLADPARKEPVDILTVPEELRRREWLDQCGGVAYISTLAESVPTAAHVQYYAGIVQKKAKLRRQYHTYLDLAHKALEEADEPESLVETARVFGDGIVSTKRRKAPTVLSAQALRDMRFPPRTWLIDGLLPVPAVALIAGAPKAKKSFFALDVACAIVKGGMALGKIPVKQHSCLCCFTEDSFEDVRDRLNRQFEGGEWPEHLYVTEECPRMDEGGEAWLHEFLDGHPDVRYVVLDPLVNVRGAGRNTQGNAYYGDYDDIAPFRRVARQHRVTLFIIHHTNKKISDDPFQIISGTQGILGSVDVAMVLQADLEVQTAVLHAKGRRVKPVKKRLVWDEHIGWVDDGEETPVAQMTQQQLAALSVLASGPISYTRLVAGIVSRLQCSEGAAKMLVKRLKESGKVAKEGSVYWIAGNGSNEGVTSVTPLPEPSHRHEMRDFGGHGGDEDDRYLVTPEGDGGEGPLPHRYPESLPLNYDNPCLGEPSGNGGNGGNAGFAPRYPLPAPLDLADPDAFETTPAEAEARQRAFNLAYLHGWPAFEGEETTIQGDEADWRQVLTYWNQEWAEHLLSWLEAR